MQDEYKIEHLIKIIVIILLIVAIFYGITIIVMNHQNKNMDTDTTDTEAEIQYEEILIGSMYNQKEEEYYVLVELASDYLTLNSVISNYSETEGALKIYRADLNNGFNKQYLGEESNFESEYPIFSKSTLLKISNKKIIEYTEGTDEIQKKLG